jgi:cyclopropane-fatty-acyl-phospholipid synthase
MAPPSILKSLHGIPHPAFPIPRGVVMADEARTARRRFYPVTILFSAYALPLLTIAFMRHPVSAAIYLAAGITFWTLLEYLVHRFVLHGRFPDGQGWLKHRLHQFFDTMHGDHHLRPWDGNYINGYLDSIPFALLFIAVSFLAPYYKWPVFVAGLLQSYVIEEWVHYSVHFHHFKSRYWQHIRRHHWYHHSRWGSTRAFGLTSGLWDSIVGTAMVPRPRPTPPAPGDRRTPEGQESEETDIAEAISV